MKIAIALWDLNISGGTQRQALELAKNLQKIGHDVKVYAVYYNDEKCYPDLIKKLGVQYLYKTQDEVGEVAEGLLYRFFRPWRELINEKIYYELLDLIDSDIELLNCHDYRIYPLGAKFKERYKKPTVYMMNDLPIYKARLNSIKEIIKLLLAPIRGKLFYTHRHKHYIASYDRITVLDEYNKRKLKHNIDLDSVVVRGGLDINRFQYVQRVKPNDVLRILINGIFFPWRRFEDVVNALNVLKKKNIDFELFHVGTDKRDPFYANEIYKLVDGYNLNDKVKFHGHVNDEELINLYQSSDIFVYPNSPQTWGLAVFEAMACGTPVIVSTGCGASEVLTDGESALLVPPKSPEKISDAIIKLKENPNLWRRLSTNGRKFVEENIRWDLYTKNMLRVFEEVLRNK